MRLVQISLTAPLAATGNRPGALAECRKAMEIAATLAARDPENAGRQRNLMVSLVKLAETGGDAVDRYKAALNVAQALHQEGRLPPSDRWLLEELERRLKKAAG